ncbi:hypothetical protein SKAU_G00284020 [Synaphobranchus kaupii]|uniref:Fibronectin type-III domain-containing protein n=1 Tax=Synaphobranchus kaupii TaxID=118154 RepID=A0A9Q1EXN6_SYNKA|nr:hypothetical protein SKAU_G00284020 [Synaphobranchus kaupii]
MVKESEQVRFPALTPLWMACCPGPCHMAGHTVSGLQCSDLAHMMAALEVPSGSSLVQENKVQLVERILQEPDREGCINVLGRLLSSSNSQLCSTAAYLLGALAERDGWVQETLEGTQGDNAGLVGALGALLTNDDPDTVMNAAGAIASLVGSSVGRGLLLREEAVFWEVLASLPTLLCEERESTVNYAALVAARLSLCEEACQRLLQHPSAPKTLRNLAQCLAHSHTDTAMNAAFAVGRLCGTEEGRSLLLALEQEHQLVSSLQALLCEGRWPGAGQTACFALSSLLTEADGHALVLGSPAFPHLLDGLLRHLLEEEHDSAWFAAMTVKVIVSRPRGVLCVREHSLLEERLQSLSQSCSISQELQEEVTACLRKLQRLSKPLPPETSHLPSGSYVVSWEKCTSESGLEVTYSLLDRDEVLYRGTQCHLTLPNSTLQSRCTLSLRLVQSTDGGDVSPCSEPTLLAVESKGVELMPGPPQQLRVIGCTPTQVRLSWAAPEGGLKPRMYQLYCGEMLLETTMELGAIMGGLSPGTLYQLGVCAVGPGDTSGLRATVDARTSECHDHAPAGLTMTVLGRHELLVSWGAPGLPLGRLFNYELRLNGRVAYLGTERAYTARRLAANTAYTCTVTAITSRGRCQSRPVTKRTARDEYVHTQRCLYSPSRQPPLQTPACSLPVREVTEVREKGKKSPSPHGHRPKGHMSAQSDRETASNRERHRRSSILALSPGFNSSQTSIRSTEEALGTVSGCYIKASRRSGRESVEGRVEPKSAPHRPLLARRAGTDGDLLLRQTPLTTPQPMGATPHPVGPTPRPVGPTPRPVGPTPHAAASPRPMGDKANMGVLLQHNVPGGGASEWGSLPSIIHRVPGLVKCKQPVYHVWSDLDRPTVDWMEQKQSRLLGDRSKVMRQPIAASEIRPGRSMRANRTVLS